MVRGAYLSIAHCGCIHGACIDDDTDNGYAKKEAARWLRSKGTREVRYITQPEIEAVKKQPNFLNHHPDRYKDPAKCPLAQKDMFGDTQ